MNKSSKDTDNVAAFLTSLDHPLKKEVIALRQIILDAHPTITEGIKWNVPSFRTSEYFATFHLRAKDSVQVILHRGAKPRGLPAAGFNISDPHSLLIWLDQGRAAVKFYNLNEIEARRSAFTDVIRQWIQYV